MCLYITENIEARILYIRGLGHTAIGHYAPYAVAVAKARSWARCGLLVVFDGPAALAMFLECIRDVGEWVREGWLRFWVV